MFLLLLGGLKNRLNNLDVRTHLDLKYAAGRLRPEQQTFVLATPEFFCQLSNNMLKSSPNPNTLPKYLCFGYLLVAWEEPEMVWNSTKFAIKLDSAKTIAATSDITTTPTADC